MEATMSGWKADVDARQADVLNEARHYALSGGKGLRFLVDAVQRMIAAERELSKEENAARPEVR